MSRSHFQYILDIRNTDYANLQSAKLKNAGALDGLLYIDFEVLWTSSILLHNELLGGTSQYDIDHPGDRLFIPNC